MPVKVRENLRFDEKYYLVGQTNYNVKKWATRHNQCLLLFFTITIAYSMRSCIGVAIVAMIRSDRGHQTNGYHSVVNGTNNFGNYTEGTDSVGFQTNGFFNALLLAPPYPQFHWSKKVQEVIISAFFWGYMVLQIPAGQIAYRFGARQLLFGALVINCLLSLMFPLASYYGGWIFAVICRVGQGLSQACLFPSIHTILGRWSPLEERGRMSAIIYGGQPLGTVLGLPITGLIASSPLGWPGIFIFYGMLSGCVAAVLWFFLADHPAQHKKITIAERKYIEDSLGQNHDKKQLPVPWKKILTSPGMTAISVAHIANTWCQITLYSQVPEYMHMVMGVNIKANGLLTALPFMMMFFTNFFFSWLTDMIIVKKYLNVTQTRKFANTIGFVPAAICFVVLAYAPKNIYVVESLLVAICCFAIAAHLGFYINHIDISPNFAGVMMSISNFCGNCVGSFAPIVTGFILTDVTDQYLWRKVFFIAGGLYFFTNLVYVMLGTGEVAVWNDLTQYEQVATNEEILLQVERDGKDCNNSELEENG